MKFTFNSVHAIVGTVVVALVSMQGGAQAAGIAAHVRNDPTLQTNTAEGGSQTWDFSGSSPSGVTLSGGAIVNGSSGQHASPNIGDPYLTVGGAATTATLTFETALRHFGVFWGTPDTYNKLNFYNGPGTPPIASFVPGVGQLQLSNPPSGPLGLGSDGLSTSARYVDFFADAGTVFNRVEFVSTQVAFEVDNIAYSKVPTPAMLPAIIGFGLTALKRRKQAAQA
jgi:hypothetical protein